MFVAAAMTLELVRKTYRVLILGENGFQLYGSFLVRSILLLELFLDFPNIVTTAYDFAVHAGVLAGGAGITFATFQDPGEIFKQSFTIGDVMLSAAKDQFSITYMLPENRNCFLKGWKNKGLQEVTASETRKMGG